MIRIKLSVTGLVCAAAMLAGCQGDSYWRAKQSAEFHNAERDIEEYETRRYASGEAVYDSRYNTNDRSDRLTGFSQDSYWGEPRDPGIDSHPRDTYAYPRTDAVPSYRTDNFAQDDYFGAPHDPGIDSPARNGNYRRDTYVAPRDTNPQNSPRDPNLLD